MPEGACWEDLLSHRYVRFQHAGRETLMFGTWCLEAPGTRRICRPAAVELTTRIQQKQR